MSGVWAKVPDWAPEGPNSPNPIWDEDTNTAVIEYEGGYYIAQGPDLGIRKAPAPGSSVLWMRTPEIKAEPVGGPNGRPSPLRKSDPRVKEGKLPLKVSVFIPLDVGAFPSPKIVSESMSSIKTGMDMQDTSSTKDVYIGTGNGKGMNIRKDGSTVIKGNGGSELSLGESTMIGGTGAQFEYSSVTYGGGSKDTPTKQIPGLPSFFAFPLPSRLPNLELILKVTSITSAVMKMVKSFKEIKNIKDTLE